MIDTSSTKNRESTFLNRYRRRKIVAANKQQLKYGAFYIQDNLACWNGDPDVQIKLTQSPSVSCQWEGVWNPCHRPLQTEYRVAMSGLCIWSKYDCLLQFKPRSKGNPGAIRSLSNPKDRADLFKRLEKGYEVEQIIVANNPFGLYQSKLITWQADTVQRFKISKLYYTLPIEEYAEVIRFFEKFLPQRFVEQLVEILNSHHDQLEEKIRREMEANVCFVHPLRYDSQLSVIESYTWPYQNFDDIELGIEEMEEIRIPYQVLQTGSTVPPILLGMLGTPCPYYVRRNLHEDDYIKIIP